MAEFDIQSAFSGLHERFDTMDTNLREVRDQGIASKTKLDALVGNGQPGEIHHIKDRLTTLEEWKNKALGYVAGVSAVIAFLGFLMHSAWDVLKGVKH